MPDDIAQYICELVVLADILQGDRAAPLTHVIALLNSADFSWRSHLILGSGDKFVVWRAASARRDIVDSGDRRALLT